MEEGKEAASPMEVESKEEEVVVQNVPSQAGDAPVGKESEKEEVPALPETTPLNASDLEASQLAASLPIIGIDFGSSSSVVASSVVGSSKLPTLVQNRISSVGTPFVDPYISFVPGILIFVW